MAYGKRSRVPYEETPAGMRAAKAKERNKAYIDSRNQKIKGFTKIGSDAKSPDLDAVKILGPRSSWKRIGSESNPDTGEPTENLFSIPGIGYFVDYGMGGAYYVSPRGMTRVKAKTTKHRKWTGASLTGKRISRNPMLRKVHG